MNDDPRSDAGLLVDLGKAFALSDFFPLKHPTLVGAILKLESALLARARDLHLEILPGGLALDGVIPARRSPHVQRLAERLNDLGVRTLTLRHEIGSEALGRFLSERRGHVPGKIELDSVTATQKLYWKVFWEQPEVADSLVTPTQRELFPLLKNMVAVPKRDRENSQWNFGSPVLLVDRPVGRGQTGEPQRE